MSAQATQMKVKVEDLTTQKLVSDEKRKVAESSLSKTDKLAKEMQMFLAIENERSRVMSEGEAHQFRSYFLSLIRLSCLVGTESMKHSGRLQKSRG